MTAIRSGLVCMMPLMIVGSFAVLINNVPLDSFRAFMSMFFGETWKDVAGAIYNGTSRMMALGSVFSVSYAIVRTRKSSDQFNSLIAALVSLGCLVTLFPTSWNALPFEEIGPMGLFLAIVVAVTASSLFLLFFRHKLFRTRIFSDAADPLVMQALAALEPAMWTFLTFALIRHVFSLWGIEDLHTLVYSLLRGVFESFENGLASALFFVFSVHLFWLCGLHGSNILETVTQRLWVPKLAVNVAVAQAGGVPNEIFTKQFFDIYVLMGGSGATFCLIAAILIAARRSNTSKLAKISIPLALFNINETMIYGIPIVFNPFYLAPFLLVPVTLTLLAYAATVLDFVPVTTGDVAWTTPVILGGYAATGSWRGAALQIVNLIVGTAIYLPFVKMNEKFKEESNQKVLEKLNSQVNYVDNRRVPLILNRPDEVGSLARVLANDLMDNASDDKGLYLVFQPQVDNIGRVIGCEALLRWRHEKFGIIPPSTTIVISEEAKLDDLLNKWIFETALRYHKGLNDLGYTELIMSVNISPLQLRNPEIVSILRRFIREYKLNPDKIEVELTENIAFDDTKESREVMERFKKMGVRIAIDDFGMGHTSLLYLRSFNVDTVKLDGSLVQDILTDQSSVDIVKSIVNLCDNRNMHVVAEVVETKEQKDLLKSLGCHYYQGYYYSRPLEINNFVHFLESNDCETK
ncbi:MAG: EAL domain-containing protein [Synergistaceae bacterium]|jgi:lactose/cellobiose-specific phosphotransferase system IIC component|nr:EAL domain-containing protein [Synergistaceae bacterium]